MLRISDARMSGTSYGTVVLHTTPEAAAGGPLAVVQTGDEIELNVDERRLDLLVPAEELERRLAAWTPPAPHYTRGYGRLFIDNVLGADTGCDFDFLRADGIEHADYGPLYARMGALVAAACASGEQRPQVVVEEDAVGVELAADRDEAFALGVALGELLGRQEVQLAPVDACAELAQEAVDGAQVGPVVAAGHA